MISCRSTVGFLVWRREAQTVIAGAVGRRLDRQRQRCRGCYRLSRGGIALPRQDVEHDVAAEHLGRQRLGTGRLDRIEPGLGHSRQDVDELAIAVVLLENFAPAVMSTVGTGSVLGAKLSMFAASWTASLGWAEDIGAACGCP